MPTYEYQCARCDHEFELVQSIHDKPRSRCPLCRGKVTKLIAGGIGISFKGSGFYVTYSGPKGKMDISTNESGVDTKTVS